MEALVLTTRFHLLKKKARAFLVRDEPIVSALSASLVGRCLSNYLRTLTRVSFDCPTPISDLDNYGDRARGQEPKKCCNLLKRALSAIRIFLRTVLALEDFGPRCGAERDLV